MVSLLHPNHSCLTGACYKQTHPGLHITLGERSCTVPGWGTSVLGRGGPSVPALELALNPQFQSRGTVLGGPRVLQEHPDLVSALLCTSYSEAAISCNFPDTLPGPWPMSPPLGGLRDHPNRNLSTLSVLWLLAHFPHRACSSSFRAGCVQAVPG